MLFQKEDTLIQYDFFERKINKAKSNLNYLEHRDTVVFSSGKKIIKQWNYTAYENIQLMYDSIQSYLYVKTEKSSKITEQEFLKKVNAKIFQTNLLKNKTPNSNIEIHESIRFSKDSITYFWDYYFKNTLLHKETETVELNMFEVEDQLFLVPSNKENPYPIYQVFELTEDKIELRNFIDFEMKSVDYKLAEDIDISTYSNYSLCKDYFQKIYYVGENVRYSYGMEHLLKRFQENAPNAEGDGFVNIHFTINCEGKVGRLGLELLDRNYKSTSFNPEIVKHIVNKILKIKSWDNLNTDPYYGSEDVKVFFLIKIENGIITDVCP